MHPLGASALCERCCGLGMVRVPGEPHVGCYAFIIDTFRIRRLGLGWGQGATGAPYHELVRMLQENSRRIIKETPKSWHTDAPAGLRIQREGPSTDGTYAVSGRGTVETRALFDVESFVFRRLFHARIVRAVEGFGNELPHTRETLEAVANLVGLKLEGL
jgi:hypothetical protein